MILQNSFTIAEISDSWRGGATGYNDNNPQDVIIQDVVRFFRMRLWFDILSCDIALCTPNYCWSIKILPWLRHGNINHRI
mmetsp:Transcript_23907/g.29083  ORF Transcript_23907/g.29083 Transcript_23907/m.29083 type:complete len:80 (+) Transcript_23907:2-241(+)